MVDFNGQFGVTLKAFTELDRGSLNRAQKDVGQALGKKQAAGGVDQAEKKVAAGASRARLWAKSIDDVKGRLRASWHLDGVGRAVDQLREGRRQINDLGESASKLLSPVGIAMGAGSLAGIGAMVESYGARSGGLLRLSGNMGVTTDFLQRIQGGAQMAGLSAEDATGAVDTLQRTLWNARFGLDPKAIGTAKMLGVDVQDNPENFLLNIADKMKGQAPQVQREIAEAFGIQDLLPMLRQGREAVEEYMAAAKRNRDLTDDQVRAGRELEKAYAGAEQATLGLKDAVASQLAPAFVPMLNTWNEWMNDVKEAPGKLQLLSNGVTVLGAAFGTTLVLGIARAALALTRFGGVSLLPGVAGVAAGAAAGAGIQATTGKPIPWWEILGASLSGPATMVIGTMGEGLARYMNWGLPGKATGGSGKLQVPGQQSGNEGAIRGAIAAAGGNAMAQAGLLSNFSAESRLNAGAVNPSGGATGWAQWIGSRKSRLAAIAASLGVSMTDPKAQAALLQEELSGPYAGVIAQMNAAKTPEEAALIGLRLYEGVNEQNSLVAGAPWDRMVATHTAKAGDFYNEAGSDHMMSKGDEAELSDWYQSLDTTHHVIVDLNGAPAGTRTRVAAANGPSDLTVRTQMAFQNP